MRQSTSITGYFRWLVCRSVGLSVTHSFYDPHVLPIGLLSLVFITIILARAGSDEIKDSDNQLEIISHNSIYSFLTIPINLVSLRLQSCLQWQEATKSKTAIFNIDYKIPSLQFQSRFFKTTIMLAMAGSLNHIIPSLQFQSGFFRTTIMLAMAGSRGMRKSNPGDLPSPGVN